MPKGQNRSVDFPTARESAGSGAITTRTQPHKCLEQTSNIIHRRQTLRYRGQERPAVVRTLPPELLDTRDCLETQSVPNYVPVHSGCD